MTRLALAILAALLVAALLRRVPQRPGVPQYVKQAASWNEHDDGVQPADPYLAGFLRVAAERDCARVIVRGQDWRRVA